MSSQKTKHFKKQSNWKIYDRKLSKLETTPKKPNRTQQVMSSSVIYNPTTIEFVLLTCKLSWYSSELKSPHINLLQYNTAVRTQKEQTDHTLFKCGTRRKMESPGQTLHLNCLRRRDTQGHQCMVQNPFSTCLMQLCFLLQVRDCQNPTVVLVPLSNSQEN